MTIDARGKACPQPVVLALHALAELKEGENLEVWVDNSLVWLPRPQLPCPFIASTTACTTQWGFCRVVAALLR